ncbi:hypothetical protein FRC06_010566, partial [Ceratobasidium sp. 370]
MAGQVSHEKKLGGVERTHNRRFGLITGPVVKSTEELVLLHMLTQCAFPEATWTSPKAEESEDEDQGEDRDKSNGNENPTQWSVFDEWMLDCSGRANLLVRPGKLPVTMLPEHQGWVRLQLAQP